MSLDDILSKGREFINKGSEDPVITEPSVMSEFIPVGQILVIAGNAVVIVVVAVMAIRWIIAKPDQQAKLKEQLIGLVISVVVIYGAVGIWAIIKNFMEGL